MNLRKLKRIIKRLWRLCRPQCIAFLVIVTLLIALLVYSCAKDDSKPSSSTQVSITPTGQPTETLPPSPTATQAPTDTPTPTPEPLYGYTDSTTTDVNAVPIEKEGWEVDFLMLVNWNNRLKYSGNPEGLVYVKDVLSSDKYIIEDPETCMCNETALQALKEMSEDALAAGCPYVKISKTGAYRTFKTQDDFWQARIETDPNYGSDPYNNPPRTVPANASEHRTGLGFDIWVPDSQYAWFHENCHRYGFILRYPGDKIRYTGIMYEQWHFRYVGVEAATEMRDMGFCLEEYIAFLNGADITPYPTKPVTRPTATPTPGPTTAVPMSPTPTPTVTPTPGLVPDGTPTPTPELPPEDITPTPELPPENTPTPEPENPPEDITPATPTPTPSPTPTPEPAPENPAPENPEGTPE